MVWTTGSTGMPKGAWFDHETMAFIAANMGPLSVPYDRKLIPVPFAHTAYMTRIYDQVVHRAALILTPPAWTAEAMLAERALADGLDVLPGGDGCLAPAL